MPSRFSLENFPTLRFFSSSYEWSCQKLENLTRTTSVIVAAVLFLVLSFITISLAFIVRCDDSNWISHFEHVITSVEDDYTKLSTSWNVHLLKQEENYKAKKLQWISPRQFSKDLVEPSGYENYDTHIVSLYIGRTSYGNGMIVGKYVSIHEYTYFAYGGIEHFRSQCEVLVYPKGTVSWILKEEGTVLPGNATLVYGGVFPTTQETGYICRFKMEGHLVIGMTHRQSNGQTVCSSPIVGFERTTETFEILVINAMGRILGIDSSSSPDN